MSRSNPDRIVAHVDLLRAVHRLLAQALSVGEKQDALEPLLGVPAGNRGRQGTDRRAAEGRTLGGPERFRKGEETMGTRLVNESRATEDADLDKKRRDDTPRVAEELGSKRAGATRLSHWTDNEFETRKSEQMCRYSQTR